MACHFSDPAPQFVGKTLPLVDVNADAFAKDEFHGRRMTQLNDNFDNEVDAFVVWCNAVQMYRVVHGRIPRHQRTYLRIGQNITHAASSINCLPPFSRLNRKLSSPSQAHCAQSCLNQLDNQEVTNWDISRVLPSVTWITCHWVTEP